MRCKQGDLAIIGHIPPGTFGSRLSGQVVCCLSYERVQDTDCWITDPPLFSESGTRLVCEDFYLTPFKPQPDDAVDEMITLLGIGSPITYPSVIKRKTK